MGSARGSREAYHARSIQSVMLHIIVAAPTVVEKSVPYYLRIIKDAKRRFNVEAICSVGMLRLLNHLSTSMHHMPVALLISIHSLTLSNVSPYTLILQARISVGIPKIWMSKFLRLSGPKITCRKISFRMASIVNTGLRFGTKRGRQLNALKQLLCSKTNRN